VDGGSKTCGKGINRNPDMKCQDIARVKEGQARFWLGVGSKVVDKGVLSWILWTPIILGHIGKTIE
jgi:hypothetical protein